MEKEEKQEEGRGERNEREYEIRWWAKMGTREGVERREITLVAMEREKEKQRGRERERNRERHTYTQKERG